MRVPGPDPRVLWQRAGRGVPLINHAGCGRHAFVRSACTGTRVDAYVWVRVYACTREYTLQTRPRVQSPWWPRRSVCSYTHGHTHRSSERAVDRRVVGGSNQERGSGLGWTLQEASFASILPSVGKFQVSPLVTGRELTRGG